MTTYVGARRTAIAPMPVLPSTVAGDNSSEELLRAIVHAVNQNGNSMDLDVLVAIIGCVIAVFFSLAAMVRTFLHHRAIQRGR